MALRRIEEDFGTRIETPREVEPVDTDPAQPTYPIEGLIPEDASHTYPSMLQIAGEVGDVFYAADLDEHGEPRQRVDPARIIYLKATIIDELPLILRGYKARKPARLPSRISRPAISSLTRTSLRPIATSGSVWPAT